MFNSKIKAGALQLTIGIIVIIALLLLSFVLLVHIHKTFKIQTQFVKEAVTDTNNSINYSMNNTVVAGDTITIVDAEYDYKTQMISKEFWGIFEKVYSKTKIKGKEFQKVALIGGGQKDLYRPVLYLKDNNKPLVLVGNTKIEGVSYLPQQGVKPGTISGQSFYGSQLIYGPINYNANLPIVSNELDKHLSKLSANQLTVESRYIINIEPGKSYFNSFYNPTQYVFSNGAVSLQSVNLTGNITIVSNSKIKVEASSLLKDVILIAPEIEIQNNVQGNFQAIAQKFIEVGKNVNLNYPSALVLINKETSGNTNSLEEKNHIYIDEHSIIKGLVFYQGKSLSKNYASQIEVNENTKIIGEVYCNDNTSLKGKVFGTVYTNNFITKAYGSIYQNHLLNAQMTIDSLPEQYVGLTLKDSKKGVAKWLY